MIDMPDTQTQLGHANGGAAAIDQQFFISCLNRRRRAKGIDLRIGDAGAKQVIFSASPPVFPSVGGIFSVMFHVLFQPHAVSSRRADKTA